LFGAQCNPHARLELDRVEGLRYVVGSSSVERLGEVAWIFVCGEKQDRYVAGPGIFLEMPAHLESVDLRHVDVEQDDVGLVLDGDAKPHGGRNCLEDLVDDAFEASLHSCVDTRIVVDDEDRDARHEILLLTQIGQALVGLYTYAVTVVLEVCADAGSPDGCGGRTPNGTPRTTRVNRQTGRPGP